MKKIIFVDDDQNILRGLRRVLRFLNGEWEVFYAASGREALSILGEYDIDIIVSDYRMPEMNGYELLTQVQKEYPQVVRAMLTGQPDKETYTDSIQTCHYFLWKPLNIDEFKLLLTKLTQLDSLIENPYLKKRLCGMTSLPTLPEVYRNLVRLLSDPDGDYEAIVAMIHNDVALSAQVLKIVNSSCYGLIRKIALLDEAVQYIGVNTLRSMVLAHHIFQEGLPVAENFNMHELWQHSLLTAQFSEALVGDCNDKNLEAMASFGGLLHDVGKLILVHSFPESYAKIEQLVVDDGCDQLEAEVRILGANHATIGAYLLSLWGLPEAIVLSALNHHQQQCPSSELESGAVEAVWHANRIANGKIDQSDECLSHLQQNQKYCGLLKRTCLGGADVH